MDPVPMLFCCFPWLFLESRHLDMSGSEVTIYFLKEEPLWKILELT